MHCGKSIVFGSFQVGNLWNAAIGQFDIISSLNVGLTESVLRRKS